MQDTTKSNVVSIFRLKSKKASEDIRKLLEQQYDLIAEKRNLTIELAELEATKGVISKLELQEKIEEATRQHNQDIVNLKMHIEKYQEFVNEDAELERER